MISDILVDEIFAPLLSIFRKLIFPSHKCSYNKTQRLNTYRESYSHSEKGMMFQLGTLKNLK